MNRLAKSIENQIKRKASGGRTSASRGRRGHEWDGFAAETILGEDNRIVTKVRGGGRKTILRTVQYANVVDQSSGKSLKVKILRVTKNPASRDYERRSVITKGSIIETERGLAKVVSRPGQDGVVNAILTR